MEQVVPSIPLAYMFQEGKVCEFNMESSAQSLSLGTREVVVPCSSPDLVLYTSCFSASCR